MDGESKRSFLKLVLANLALLHLSAPVRAILAFFKQNSPKEVVMILPEPDLDGQASVEKAIKRRRTVRSFSPQPITIQQLSQLLFAAQGITEDHGFKRAAPSGGALYPLDIYAVVGEKSVAGIDAGIYHYLPGGHRIELTAVGDRRVPIARASLHQMWMAQPPLNFVITAEYDRICSKYGKRGVRYAMIEAGHVGQNIFLQAETLGLKAGIVGAFADVQLIQAMDIPRQHEPLLVMPVGRSR